MISSCLYKRYPAWLGIGLTLFGHSSFAEPLSFEKALQLAEQQAPSLIASTARINAAYHAAIPAGELPDPKLFFGIDNLPVNGSDRFSLSNDFMTMQKIGVMQDMPNTDKRQARRDGAQAVIERAEAESLIERLKVRREAAIAWITVQFVEQKLALFETLFHENKLLKEAVRAQLAGGKANAGDTVMPKQEAAMLDERKDELKRDLVQARAKLKQWVGAEGDEPLSGSVPAWPIHRETYIQHVHRHPELATFKPMVHQAEADVRETQAMKKPDWSWQVGYAKRGALYSDMAMLQFTVDLPLFSRTRQNPNIAAKQSELTRIESEREVMLREHRQMLEADLAEYERLDRAIQRSTQTFTPLAQEKVSLTLASYRASKADLNTVINARREQIELKIKHIDLESQRAMMAAKLHFSYGENLQ